MKNLKFYKLKNRMGALILATTMLGTIAVLGGCDKNRELDQNIIEELQDENGIESKILRYIELSKKLEDLNLENYYLGDEELIELDSPEEIEKQINNYDERNITNIRYLKMQEILVNKYIYDKGYKVAYENSKIATKKYAAELYGFVDASDLEMNYYNSQDSDVNNPFQESVYMEYKTNYIPEKITIKNKDIINGVRAMANTQTNSDYNEMDNSSYNEERNYEIKKALVTAKQLDNIVDSQDLYDEKEANRIKR